MHLLVWEIEEYRNPTLKRYSKHLGEALKGATEPTKNATGLGLLVAQYFEERGIITSRIPLEHRVFEDKEVEEYYSSAWYATENLRGEECGLNIYSDWFLWDNQEMSSISVSLRFYPDSKKREFSPEDAYRKYPVLAVENMAIFPGLDVVAWVQRRSDLDTVLPLMDRYINLTMRYEELVVKQAQKFHGGIERLSSDDAWPYDPLDALVFGYVPLSSVKQMCIEGTWALFDNLRLQGASPIEVGIVPIQGAVPFYPTRQTETSPAFAQLFDIYTNVTDGQARIMAENSCLLLSQNPPILAFDEHDTEMVQRLVRVVREVWERRILED